MATLDADFASKTCNSELFRSSVSTMENQTSTSLSPSNLPFSAPYHQNNFYHSTPGNDGNVVMKAASKNTEPTVEQAFEDRVTVFRLIKSCGIEKDLHSGNNIHARLVERGILVPDVGLNNALLSMYAKCGSIARARQMFEDLPAPTVVSWNALIAAHVLHGFHQEALALFDCMQDRGLSPNAVTFASILKACSSLKAADRGAQIHAKISQQGLLQNNVVLGTAVIDMYAKCGELSKARAVLDNMQATTVASWTALMTGYLEQGFSDEALSCFYNLEDEGLLPDAATLICTLKACGNLGKIHTGRKIQIQANGQGLLANDIAVGNALLDMYVKCGSLAEARRIFNNLVERDVTTWTTIISGFTDHGLGMQAVDYFKQMLNEDLVPSEVTFICALKACGRVCMIDLGEKIHSEAEKRGLFYKNVMLSTAVIDMYFKCGMLMEAQEVFDKVSERTLVTWNVLISGYVQHDLSDEALSYYKEMLADGFFPDLATFRCIMKACGNIGVVEEGIELHKRLWNHAFIKKDMILGTALVDMYAKCGVLERAQAVFDEVQERGVALWNALIGGYAQVGMVKATFDKFITMLREGVQPSVVTFVVLLTMCSHEGLIEQGLLYFDQMSCVYKVVPIAEHHCCMVDIFARAGQFDKAINLIENAPLSDCSVLWSALLGSFLKDLDLKFGR